MAVQHELDAVLRGHVLLESAAPAIQSWARLFIHQAAVQLLDDVPRDQREARLSSIPEGLRQPIRNEANRVWAWRRN